MKYDAKFFNRFMEMFFVCILAFGYTFAIASAIGLVIGGKQ